MTVTPLARSPVPPVVVRFADATIGYGSTAVLERVDLEVAAGELVGIVGPSGVGKTTLLRAVTGQASVFTGEVSALGQRPRPRRAPRGLGYVPQLESIDWDFPLTVEQVVLLGGGGVGSFVPWFSRREKDSVRDVLARLGIESLARRSIRELSGGQRQRMFVARALMHGARVILLDEPTSGVDVATRRDVLAMLESVCEAGIAVVLTTHDLNHVAAHLPRIVCVNRGVVADGAPFDVLVGDVLEETYGAPMDVIRDRGRIVVVDEVGEDGPAAPAGSGSMMLGAGAR